MATIALATPRSCRCIAMYCRRLSIAECPHEKAARSWLRLSASSRSSKLCNTILWRLSRSARMSFSEGSGGCSINSIKRRRLASVSVVVDSCWVNSRARSNAGVRTNVVKSDAPARTIPVSRRAFWSRVRRKVMFDVFALRAGVAITIFQWHLRCQCIVACEGAAVLVFLVVCANRPPEFRPQATRHWNSSRASACAPARSALLGATMEMPVRTQPPWTGSAMTGTLA